MSVRINVSVTGGAELRARFKRLGIKVGRKLVREAMKEAVEPVLAAAVARVPVDTGSLKKGLTTKVKQYDGGRKTAGIIGPSRGKYKKGTVHYGTDPATGRRVLLTGMRVTRYAHMVEKGTRKMAARPFLRPAWSASQHTFRRTFEWELLTRVQYATYYL